MILQNDNRAACEYSCGVSSSLRQWELLRAGWREESDSYRPRFSPSAAISKKTRGRAMALLGGLAGIAIISYE